MLDKLTGRHKLNAANAIDRSDALSLYMEPMWSKLVVNADTLVNGRCGRYN